MPRLLNILSNFRFHNFNRFGAVTVKLISLGCTFKNYCSVEILTFICQEDLFHEQEAKLSLG